MLELAILIVLGYGGWWFYRRLGGGTGVGPAKCRGCRFAVRSDADGTLCSLGGKEVFKNRIQVSWCQNRQP